MVTGHVDAELLVPHLPLHGAPFLNAPVPHLLPKYVSWCPILLDILLARKVGTTKSQVDAAVKEAAGIVVADCPQLGRIQREIQAIPLLAEDTISL